MLKERGVSGIIALLFLLLAFFIIFYSLYTLSQSAATYVQGSVEKEDILRKSFELSRSVRGYYTYFSFNGSLNINLTSSYGEPVFVSRSLIIFQNGNVVMSNFVGCQIPPRGGCSFTLNGVFSEPGSVIVSVYTTTGALASISAINSAQGAGQPPGTMQFKYLTLVENNTILFDDFYNDPISLGRIVNITGALSWRPGMISIIGSRAADQESVAYLNLSSYGLSNALPNNLYVLTKALPPDQLNSYADILFLNSTYQSAPFYDAGFLFGNELQATLWEYDGKKRSNLDSGNPISYSAAALLEAHINKGQAFAYLEATAVSSSFSDVSYVNYNDTSPLTAGFVGLGSYKSTNMSFIFIYLTKNRDPFYAYLTGVPSSYIIKVFGSDGTEYMVDYDNNTNMFRILLFNDPSSFSPILRGAYIFLFNGQELVASYHGDLAGGCVFSLQ